MDMYLEEAGAKICRRMKKSWSFRVIDVALRLRTLMPNPAKTFLQLKGEMGLALTESK